MLEEKINQSEGRLNWFTNEIRKVWYEAREKYHSDLLKSHLKTFSKINEVLAECIGSIENLDKKTVRKIVNTATLLDIVNAPVDPYIDPIIRASRLGNDELIKQMCSYVWKCRRGSAVEKYVSQIGNISKYSIKAGLMSIEFCKEHVDSDFLDQFTYCVNSVAVFRNAKITLELIEYWNKNHMYQSHIHAIQNVIEKCKSDNDLPNIVNGMKVFEKYDPSLIKQAIWLCKDNWAVKQALQIPDKYPDHYSQIFHALENYPELDGNTLSEFLTRRAKRKIDNAIDKKEAIDYVIKNRVQHISDTAVKRNCSYFDIELLQNTERIVKEIHKDRKNSIPYILDKFYCELNRAIGQEERCKYKLRNLRDYCIEVQKQIRDNVDELMVMHYG